MNVILRTLWFWPHWFWRYFSGGPICNGQGSQGSLSCDVADLEFFRYAQLTEIRNNRSLNLLILPHQEADGCLSSKTRRDTVIFFVHGSMANMQQFEFQIEHFLKDHYDVVAFDSYGCGASPKPKDRAAYSHAEMFADLVELFRRERGRRNILIAHSYGTSMALQLAAHVRAEAAAAAAAADTGAAGAGGAGVAGGAGGGVDALVLLAPGFAPAHYPAKSLQLFRKPLWLLQTIAPLLRQGFVSRALHAETRREETELHRRLLARIRAANGGNPMHVCQAFYQQCVWADGAAARASEPVPALVLVGAADAITPPAWAEGLAAEMRLDAGRPVELVVVEQSSHQVMQEQPARVNAVLSDFLSRHVPPPPH